MEDNIFKDRSNIFKDLEEKLPTKNFIVSGTILKNDGEIKTFLR